MSRKKKPELPPIKTDKDGYTKCRVCGCTEIRACANCCSWVEDDLCSTCAAVVDAILEWEEYAYRPTWAALKREVQRSFLRENAAGAGGRR